jgi:hypothetical protein
MKNYRDKLGYLRIKALNSLLRGISHPYGNY